MSFKINIGTKEGKTYKLEVESEALIEKSLGDVISGSDIYPELKGYELEITGTSDSSGFTSRADVEGIGLKKVLMTYGKGMHKRSKKEGKKKRSNPTPRGLKLRKAIRGKTISPAIVQINLKVIKEGDKKLKDIFEKEKESSEESQ
jgi:ribosomal protein S6E (S10)